MIYYEHYGRKFFKSNPLDQPEETGFEDLKGPQILADRNQRNVDRDALRSEHIRGKPAEVFGYSAAVAGDSQKKNTTAFLDWAVGVANLPRAAEPAYWLISGAKSV